MKKEKKAYFLPKTKLGKLSIRFILAFFLFLIIGMVIVSTGQTGGDTVFDNLLISIPMILALISALASFFTGIFAIIKSKERSMLVFISTIIGLFLLLFLIGELIVSH